MKGVGRNAERWPVPAAFQTETLGQHLYADMQISLVETDILKSTWGNNIHPSIIASHLILFSCLK